MKLAACILCVVPIAHAVESPPAATTHIPPDPPQSVMGDMSYDEMKNMMQMDDTSRFGAILLDHVEGRHSDEGGLGAWDMQGWYGGDYNKLWIKSEGEHASAVTRNARVELFWDRVMTPWWHAQAGARQDFGTGPARTWFAIGFQGLAPYWLDTEATLYVADEGRTAARLKTELDLLLTQRLILQPEAELNAYGKADPGRQLGSGVSDLGLSVRLRYEIRREFAPYIGVVWSRRFGGTADLARAAGGSASEVQFAAGLRMWF